MSSQESGGGALFRKSLVKVYMKAQIHLHSVWDGVSETNVGKWISLLCILRVSQESTEFVVGGTALTEGFASIFMVLTM